MSSRLLLIWYGVLLLTLLLSCSECSKVRRYNVGFRIDSYFNIFSHAASGWICDLAPFDEFKCDLQFQLSVQCSDCNPSKKIFFPSENESLLNTMDLKRKDFGDKWVNVTVDTASDSPIILHLYVADDDVTRFETVANHSKDFARLFHGDKIWKHNDFEYTSWRNDYVPLLILKTYMHVQCAPSACGETCLVPDNVTFGCQDGKVVCDEETSDTACEVIAGNFVGRLKLFSYEANYSALNLTSGCTDSLSACISTNALPNQSCKRYYPLASTTYERPNISLIYESQTGSYAEIKHGFRVASYQVALKFTSVCNGRMHTEVHELRLSATNGTVFRLAHRNRMVVGVLFSGCQGMYTGSQCTRACDGCNFDKWDCFTNFSGSACAYLNLCFSACYGGTCTIRRESQELLAINDRLVVQEVDNFNFYCLCPRGYTGSRCERNAVLNVTEYHY